MKSTILSSLVTLALSLSSFGAIAAALSVAPTELKMRPSESKSSDSFNIRNSDDSDVTVQVQVKKWSQGFDGSFVLDDTEDIVALPSTLKLSSQMSRKVRIIHKKTNLPENGQASFYRVVVKELPKLNKDQKELQLQFTTGFSIPLYVENNYPKLDLSLLGTSIFVKKEAGGFRLHNESSRHLKISEILLAKQKARGLTYLLPGSTLLVKTELPLDQGVELLLENEEKVTLQPK